MYDTVLHKSVRVSIHRLVGMAWVFNKCPQLYDTINHIDGIKRNNDYRNLEWTTLRDNVIHAFETGLREENIPCRVRNIETGEVLKFRSLATVCEFLKIKSRMDIELKNRRKSILYRGKYELRIGDDNTPWVYDKAVNIENSRYIFTIDKGTPNEKVFLGYRKLRDEYKLWNCPNIHMYVKKFRKMYPNHTIKVVDNYNTKPVQVRDVHTGIVKEYPTARIAGKALGYPHGTIMTNCRRDGHKLLDKYQLRYKSDEEWPDNPSKPESPWVIKVTDKITRKETTYQSLRKAAADLGILRAVLKRCMRHPRANDKYEVKRVLSPHS